MSGLLSVLLKLSDQGSDASPPQDSAARLKLDDLSPQNEMPWRTYTGAAGSVLNPERGFRYECQQFPSAVQECITVCKQYNMTMLLVTTELKGFHTAPLNATFLQQLDDGYGALRMAGIKAISLFTYFHSCHQELEPSSFDVVCGHIGQLQPIMEKNAGVVAALQAGFLGNDGEWTRRARSGTPLADNATLLNNVSGVVGMLQRELGQLVPGRFVLLRTPSDKAFLLRQQSVLPSSTVSDDARALIRADWSWVVAGAHTAAPFGRLGYYDAGFLSTHAGTGSGKPGEIRTSYDGGTWPVTEWGANCSTAKTLADWQSRCPPVEADPFFQYMVRESLYLWVDGELFDGTPWPVEGQLGVDGIAAALRLRLQHCTTLSHRNSFFPLDTKHGPNRSINCWQHTPLSLDRILSPAYIAGASSLSEFDYIRDHLGYRFEVMAASFPSSQPREQALSLSVQLVNRGFAVLHNPST